jgi:hypothetical protein
LFVLRQEVELYRVYQEEIAACDQQLRIHLESFASKVDLAAEPIGPQPKGKKGSGTLPTSICGRSCIALSGSTGRKSTAWMFLRRRP